MNRDQFLFELGHRWLPRIADVDARLRSDPPPRVADVCCAKGWFSIGLAQAYPKVRIDGFDVDEASVEMAWRNAHNNGLTDRVTFHVRDVSEPTLNGRYDLCIAHQGLHTVRNPIGVLTTMRRLTDRSGVVILVDARVDAARMTTDIATLRTYTLAAGFYRVALLPLENDNLDFYQLYV